MRDGSTVSTMLRATQLHRCAWTCAAVALLLVGVACNSAAPGTNDDGNTLLNDAVSYQGKISGQVSESQSTRTSITDESAGQSAPLTNVNGNSVVRFQDIAGAPLVDENGNPIPPIPLNPDGSFDANNLPVGTDFNICADFDNANRCDVVSCTNIPADSNGIAGELNNAQVDPLTTLVLGKLRELMRARGLSPRDLPVSPVAIVRRIVDAYTHLFEESGIDHTITIDDLANLTQDQFGDLFDTIIPAGARAGMLIVEGNLDLAQSQDAESRAGAAAEVFLRAGFPIVDEPGGIDLSALADMAGVEAVPLSELYGNEPQLDEFEESADLGEDFFDDFSVLEPAENGEEPIVYYDTTTEPDRNFGNLDDAQDDGGVPHLPLIFDRVLLKMARIDVLGNRITLAELYAALTDIEDGLGARLTHELFDPNFAGPPLTVFQTEDGRGKAIDLEQIYRRIFESGLNRVDDQSLDDINADLHQAMVDLLGTTVPPDFDLLFGDIVDDRIGGIGDLSERIRGARVHLPFNRSGAETFYVVADGDPFDPDSSAEAVTVDADVDIDGRISNVSYNTSGEGKYYLGFTERTEQGGVVEFIVRETGRRLHGQRGPVRLSMNDDVFESIDGVPFFDFVSQSGRFYPGVDVAVRRVDFTPPPAPDGQTDPNLPPPGDDPFGPNGGDPNTGAPNGDPNAGNPNSDPNAGDPNGDPNQPPPPPPGDGTAGPAGDPLQGPAPAEFEEVEVMRIFVLATGFGPDAEPVRVNYNRETGDSSYDRNGRYLLMFTPDTEETGEFVLFNEQAGREARDEDPNAFFNAPPELPDNFEDFFNDSDDRNPDNFDDFIDDFPNGDTNGPPPPPDDFDPMDDFVDDPMDDFVDDPADTNGIEPAEFIDESGRIIVTAREISGLQVDLQSFTRVFGTDAENARYDADADPYYDDINGNDKQDAGEPTASYRPLLFDPRDWRATDIASYYRRADNGEPVGFDEVDFESDTPQTFEGVELVARDYKPRRNAFRFGRPNTAINLLTAFLPPEFFDGTRGLDRDTPVDVFTAVALVNLVMDQVFNLTADVDIDGFGPLERKRMLLDGHLFIVPLDDPFVELIRAVGERSETNADAAQ
ncbi:MAG: hypothetical protein H6817_01690 [Phycisphaerales bacterium]|nr:hypothetical protein [Phycisphaerales bacterium]